MLESLDERLPGHHRLDAVRAHLLEMDGDREAAVAHYRTAAGRTTSEAERDHLLTRAARLTAGSSQAHGAVTDGSPNRTFGPYDGHNVDLDLSDS